MRVIIFISCLGLSCLASFGCRHSSDTITSSPNAPSEILQHNKNSPPAQAPLPSPIIVSTGDTQHISVEGINSIKLDITTSRLLRVHLEKLGQFDVINLRPSANEETAINLGQFSRRLSGYTSSATYIPEPLNASKYLFFDKTEIRFSDISSSKTRPLVFDLSIPLTVQVTLIINEEVRFEGNIERPVAWRGFLQLEGALDLTQAMGLLSKQSKRKIKTEFPPDAYPAIDLSKRAFKLQYNQSLPLLFTGTEMFVIQVNKDKQIVSATIIDLDPSAAINSQLLDAIKDWKINLDGEPTAFTTVINTKPEMFKKE